MGDVFQVFAQTHWGLSSRKYASLLALYGGMGILSNIFGSRLVKVWGVKRLTGVAIISSIISSAATAFGGFRGSIIGLVIGFLGPSQSIGIIASLVNKVTSTGMPAGKLAGERAALIALLKILAPIWYSFLYLQGQKTFATGTLPFIFDIALRFVALGLSQSCL